KRVLKAKLVLLGTSAIVHLRLDADPIVTILRDDAGDREMLDRAPADVFLAVSRAALDDLDVFGLDEAILRAARDLVRETWEHLDHRWRRAQPQKPELVEDLLRLRRLRHDGPRRNLLGHRQAAFDLRLVEEQGDSQPIETLRLAVAGQFLDQRPHDQLI